MLEIRVIVENKVEKKETVATVSVPEFDRDSFIASAQKAATEIAAWMGWNVDNIQISGLDDISDFNTDAIIAIIEGLFVVVPSTAEYETNYPYPVDLSKDYIVVTDEMQGKINNCLKDSDCDCDWLEKVEDKKNNIVAYKKL